MDWKIGLESVIALFSLLSTIVYVSYRMGKLETKVDTLWEFLLKRAMGEALFKKVGEKHSPFKVSDNARSWFSGDLVKDLRQFYIEEGVGKSDMEIFILIEEKFGNRIFEEIGIPHGVTLDCCVVAAVEIAKGK